MKLSTNETAESATNNSTRIRCFSQTTGEKIDVTDVDVNTLQRGDSRCIDDVTQLIEGGDFG